MKSVVIFGGTGFVGTHLAQYLSKSGGWERIYLVDLNQPRRTPYTKELQAGLESGKIVYVKQDVRNAFAPDMLPGKVDLIFNLAAIHREPGHLPKEYFETNLQGAENVCAWAGLVGCKTIVFTSSISPYGPSEEAKVETSLPTPETPYGSSKLAAEKIHMVWQSSASGRRLLILRPGVVFGPGEGGNVTRLVHSLVKGYFVYLGNKATIKAAGYIKELCLVAQFGLDLLETMDNAVLLLNFTFDPPPTMEQMVDAIQTVIGRKRRIYNMPRKLLLGMSYPLSIIEGVLRIKLPINPTRVRKLFRSNNILPGQLRSLGYVYTYTLVSSFRDWKKDLPEDFGASDRTGS